MGARRDPLLTAVGLLVPFGALLLVAPGTLVTSVADRFLRLRFALTQCWAWAVGSSVVTACAMALRSRDGLGLYRLLAVMTSGVVLAAGFWDALAVGGGDAARVRPVTDDKN